METETALAEKVVAWFRDQHWTVYQECGHNGTADIVAVKGPLVYVVECKLQFSFSVIEQAERWLKYAHYVSVAVPSRKSTWFKERVCSEFGIGVLHVYSWPDRAPDTEWHPDSVYTRMDPVFRRKVHHSLRESLMEEHKTYAKAGSPTGRRWTPFKKACKELAELAARHPEGLPLKTFCEKATFTGYRSKNIAARKRSVVDWVDRGLVPGVKLERRNRRVFVLPDSH